MNEFLSFDSAELLKEQIKAMTNEVSAALAKGEGNKAIETLTAMQSTVLNATGEDLLLKSPFMELFETAMQQLNDQQPGEKEQEVLTLFEQWQEFKF